MFFYYYIIVNVSAFLFQQANQCSSVLSKNQSALNLVSHQYTTLTATNLILCIHLKYVIT